MKQVTQFMRSHLLASVALFVALGGSAYAANTVASEDIVDGSVASVDVQDEGLTGIDIRGLAGADVDDNSLTGDDVRGLTGDDVQNDTLTGADVSGLGAADIGGLGGADVNDNSLNGADVEALTGSDVTNDSLAGADIDEGTLSVSNMGCKTGLVKGFARIKGLSGIPSSYVDEGAFVDESHSCSAGRIEVRRADAGVYFIRFEGNPADLALVSANQDGASSSTSGDVDNAVTVGKVTDPNSSDFEAFRVDFRDAPNSDRQDGKVNIMLL
jgi:hypothetical protein